jgi:hypothetical protein
VVEKTLWRETKMTFTVHIIPTGDSIQPATGQPPTTLVALHKWVASETDTKEADQIILTGKGKHVQQQTLLTEVRLTIGEICM